MDKTKLIIDVLLELKSAAKQINSEEKLKETMHKYDMMFLGKEFNTIYAMELRSCIKKNFNSDIPKDEFLNLVPIACDSLKMECDAMVLAKDLKTLADYSIKLF